MKMQKSTAMHEGILINYNNIHNYINFISTGYQLLKHRFFQHFSYDWHRPLTMHTDTNITGTSDVWVLKYSLMSSLFRCDSLFLTAVHINANESRVNIDIYFTCFPCCRFFKVHCDFIAVNKWSFINSSLKINNN